MTIRRFGTATSEKHLPTVASSAGDVPVNFERSLSVLVRRKLPGFLLDISFDVPAGLTVLFGPSGSGKSLTLQSIAGLFPLDAARITFGGAVLHDSAAHVFLPPQKRHVGYVPQNYALFPHLTVTQNIAFGLKSRRDVERRVAELIGLMRLDGLESLRPSQISGGQQQRVSLARALAADPQLLLLDEPFSSLDAPVRETLREELLEFHRRVGVPIVLVTHDALEARMLADTVVVLQGGHVLQMGPQDTVFRSPLTPQVAALVGMRPCWSGEVVELRPAQAGTMAIIQVADLRLYGLVPAEMMVTQGQDISIGIRADELRIYAGDMTGEALEGAANVGLLVPGVVVREQLHGSLYAITVRLNAGLLVEVPVLRREYRSMGLAVGMEVMVEIPVDAVHIFESL